MGLEAPWSPDFETKPVAAAVLNVPTPEATQGYKIFYEKGCQYCHQMEGQGGNRGPNLTDVAARLTPQQMTIRIVNGGYNMPAFGGSLSNRELDDLVAFLKTRTAHGEVRTAGAP